MNILIYNQSSLIDSKAGSEVLTHKLSQSLSSLGHISTVVTRGDSDRSLTFEEVLYLQFRRGVLNKFINFYTEKKFEDAVIDIVDKGKVDLLVLCSFKNFPLLLLKKLKDMNVKIVFLVLDYNSICASIKVFNYIEYKICDNFSDHFRCFECQVRPKVKYDIVFSIIKKLYRYIIKVPIPYLHYYQNRLEINRKFLSYIDVFVYSNSTALKTIKAIINPRKNVVIEFPVAPRVGVMPIKLSCANDFSFGFIGSAIAEKGLLELINSFPVLYENRLVIYTKLSDNNYSNSIKKIINRSSHQFMGEFEYSDIEKVFGSIQVLIIPSLWVENSPLVFNDALSFSKPVIVPRSSSLAEIVEENKFGWVYDSLTDLTEIILYLIKNPEIINETGHHILNNFKTVSYRDYASKVISTV